MSETATATPDAPAATPAPETGGGFIDSIDSFFNSPATDAPDTPDTPAVAETTPDTTPKAEKTPRKVTKIESKAPTNPVSDLDSLEDEPSDWTPQAAKRFKELKNELKSTKTRAEELEATVAQRQTRLEELEAIASNPEYVAMQERIAEYEQKMLLGRLEESAAYKRLVEEPLAKLVGESDTIAAKYSIDPDRLLEALSMADGTEQEERLSEVLAQASDRDKYSVWRIIERLKPVLEQRQALHQHTQEALREAEALDQQRSQAELVQKAERRAAAAQEVAGTLTRLVPFLKDAGVDMDAIVKHASGVDPAQLDPVTGSYQAMAAKILPQVVNHYRGLQKELDVLTDRLAEYDKATPRAGGGSLVGHVAGSTEPGLSFVDAVSAAFGGR